MAVYSKPVRILMKEMAGELASEPGTIISRQDAIAWFAKKYPKVKTATVTAHLTRPPAPETHYPEELTDIQKAA